MLDWEFGQEALLARQRASLQQRRTCKKLKLGHAAKEEYKSFAEALGNKVRKVRAQLELRAGTCRVTNILITKNIQRKCRSFGGWEKTT